MRTVEDYIKREQHLINYCNEMIRKFTKTLSQYPNNYDAQIKRQAYKDILFKLNYEKPNK